MLSPRYLLLLLLVPILVGAFLFIKYDISGALERRVLGLYAVDPDNRVPAEVEINGKKRVKYPQDYTIVLIGDSMTEKLGNCDELRAYLHRDFPNKTFQLLNYSFGATNILSVPERLVSETNHQRIYRPVVDIDFDLIVIESFGNNPLSDLPLEEGLAKQKQALDQIIGTIKQENPDAKIAFLATIAPSKEKYGLGQVDLTQEKRAEWAGERIAYIKNHMEYAKAHNIPLMDAYDSSLKLNGDGNTEYLSEQDYIHPSPKGVYLISEEIAKGIVKENIFND